VAAATRSARSRSRRGGSDPPRVATASPSGPSRARGDAGHGRDRLDDRLVGGQQHLVVGVVVGPAGRPPQDGGIHLDRAWLPSGSCTTQTRTPTYRLNSGAASNLPNNGCDQAVTLTSLGNTSRRCCRVPAPLWLPARLIGSIQEHRMSTVLNDDSSRARAARTSSDVHQESSVRASVRRLRPGPQSHAPPRVMSGLRADERDTPCSAGYEPSELWRG